MQLLHRIAIFFLTASIFTYVLNYVEPPTSWIESSTFQILAFFLPLLLTIVFLINIFLHQILRSFVVGLGLMFALTLMAAKILTPTTAAITFFITGIVFVYTPHFRLRHLKPHHLKKIGDASSEHKPEKHTKPPTIIKRL